MQTLLSVIKDNDPKKTEAFLTQLVNFGEQAWAVKQAGQYHILLEQSKQFVASGIRRIVQYAA